jgi:hypothetical protein
LGKNVDKYNNKNPNFQEKAGKNAIFLELSEILPQLHMAMEILLEALPTLFGRGSKKCWKAL